MARGIRWLLVVTLVAGAAAAGYLTRERWLGRVTGESASAQTALAQAGPAQPSGRGGRRGRFAGSGGPIPVLVGVAATADVPISVDGVGTVQALNTVVVRSRVDGQLIKVLFREGQDVRAGDLLALIDDLPYQATLDQALAKQQQDQATLANAQRDLDRYVGLAQTNAVTRQQVDSQRSTVAQTQALLKSDAAVIESARASLAYTRIVAPIDGRTGLRGVDVGNIIHASDTTGIVTISQIQPISVLFSVPQQSLVAVNRAAARGSAGVEALSNDGVETLDRGTLTVVDNQVDSTTGTVRLKAQFPNPDLALWPGAFVAARLSVDTLAGVTVVPTAAVQRGPDGAYVYRVDSGEGGETVKQQTVTIGHQDDTRAVVTAGVAPGDRVVTTGFARLQNGAKVEVSTGQGAGGSQAPAGADAVSRPRAGRQHRTGEPAIRTSGTGNPANGGPAPGGSAPASSVGTAGPGAVNPASP